MKSSVRNHRVVLVFILLVATGIGLSVAQSPSVSVPHGAIAARSTMMNGRRVYQSDSGVMCVVDPETLVDAGPGQDGIPSIDIPNFVSIDEADEWLSDDDLILVIQYHGVQRAYPLQIMVWHELVNDTIAGEPVLVTYCPLCASAAAYIGAVDGLPTEFGTSGRLYNSNLVMYDRQTESYWSQFTGLCLVGEKAGEELAQLPVDVVPWGDWKSSTSNAEVLSRDTGFDRPYGEDPYRDYMQDTVVCFPVSDRNDQIPAKTMVLGFVVDETPVAVMEDQLNARGAIDLHVAGKRVRITRTHAGHVEAFNLDTGETLVSMRAFWFAWYAFYPETLRVDNS